MNQVTIQTLSFLILSVNSFVDAQGTMCSSATLTSQTVTGNCPATPPGGTCDFRCVPGYTDFNNQGVYTLRCGNDGRWQGVIPSCNRIVYCPDLGPAAGGYNSGICTSAQPGNTCSFSCPPGSQLVGPSVLTCGPDSFWDYQPPTCNVVPTCPSQKIPRGGRLQGSCVNAHPNDVCYVHCNPGYSLIGFRSIVCRRDGTWSATRASCRRTGGGIRGKRCPTVTAPKNGNINGSCTNPYPGNTCIFSCSLGYDLSSSGNLICLSNGSWDHAVPTCEEVVCEDQDPVLNGVISGFCAPGRAGQDCTLTCAKGYSPSEATVTCKEDSTWSDDFPEACTKDIGTSGRCSQLIRPPNGRIATCNRNVGGRCTFQCNRGYIIYGPSLRTCQANRKWSGAAPTCLRRTLIRPG